MNIKRTFSSLFVVMLTLILCFSATSCSKTSDTDDTTQYSSEWTYDNEYHWHEALDDSGKISDKEEHTPSDTGYVFSSYIRYTCEVCGATYESTSSTYLVYVYNIGGAGVAGATVELYNESGTLVDTVQSGSNGVARFRNLTAGTYTAKITSVPTGYTVSESDQNITLTSSSRTYTTALVPNLIDEEKPSGYSYSLGSIMYNFEFTYYLKGSTQGITTSLKDILEEKQVAILNFFYISCSACNNEFPYMNQAYNTMTSSLGGYYNEYVAMVEIDYNGTDTETAMKNYVAGNNTTYSSKVCENFMYVYDNYGLVNSFPAPSTGSTPINAFPTTYVIDRYGVICEAEEGSVTSVSSWTKLFEKYIGDDYQPDYVTASTDTDTTTDDSSKPIYEMSLIEDFKANIVTTNANTTSESFDFSAYDDEYSWPWLVNTADDNGNIESVCGATNYMYTSNANRLGTYSIIVIDVALKKGQVLSFDYYLSTELSYDYLYIQIDTVLQAKVSGESESWETFYYKALYDGYYQLTLTYQKDSSTDVGDDRVCVKDLCIVDEIPSDAVITTYNYLDSDTSGETTSLVTYTGDLLYSAATSYTLDGTQDNYYAGTGYKNYVSVYLASDGYYHVDINETGKVDGDSAGSDPYLLADLMYTTPWNSTLSIWNIAYTYLGKTASDDDDTSTWGILYENQAYAQAIEDYSWVQNNCPWGYVPINQELATILKETVKSYGTDAQADNENQWLEVCRFYVHYGAEHTSSTDLDKSTTNLALTFGIKFPEYVGTVSTSTTGDNALTFDVVVSIAQLTPRGSYYSFTVETAGVYVIYSNAGLYAEDDDAYYGADAFGWITDIDGYLVAMNDNYVFEIVEEVDGLSYYNYNFKIYVYLEAGTYMVGATFSSIEDIGTYPVVIEYVAENYVTFTYVASDTYYTYREEVSESGSTSYVYYVPYACDDYYLADDGYYYAVNADGTSSVIYINMIGFTYLNLAGYSDYTLQEMIEGYYYTDSSGNTTLVTMWSDDNQRIMLEYLAAALSNTDVTADGTSLYGYVKADATIVALLNAAINGDDSLVAENAWMLTAYYEQSLTVYVCDYSMRVIDSED